jgi:signal transduction histidine kinase
VRPRSLKTVLSVATISLTMLALLAAGALVLLGSLHHNTTIVLGASLESVRMAEEAEIDLLLYDRTSDPLVRRDLAGSLQRKLLDARAFARRPEDSLMLRQSEERVLAYLTATRRAGAPNPDSVAHLLHSAYTALEDVVNLNVTQARLEGRRAARLDLFANAFGIGLGLLLLTGAAVLVYWVRTLAFRPVFALSEVMDRFGHGDRTARAAERGVLELRAMAHRFNEMASAMARQRELQLAFLAGVVHDLRTPLSVLRTSIAAVDPDHPLPPEQHTRRVLAIVGDQIARLDRMIGDLLDAARIETGQLEVRMENRDVRDLVREVAALFGNASSRHTLVLRVPDQPILARVDPMRLEQVLGNLISNAIKYSPAGGTVDLVLECAPGEVRLSVTDHGLGITEDEQRHLFEPFHRAGGSHQGIPGAGLGLYVARRIVEAHGGRIEVESAPGIGSTFRIHLPVSA